MKNIIILILLTFCVLDLSAQKVGSSSTPQTIDISNDTLYISRSNFALLNPYLDNTNIDTTYLDGRIVSLESGITGKLVWADTLTGSNRLATGWDIAQLSVGITSEWSAVTNKPAGFLDDIDNVDDADSDPTNELFDSTFIDGRITSLESVNDLDLIIGNELMWADTLGNLATDYDISQLSAGITSEWNAITNKPAGFADDIDNVDDADSDPTNELFDSTYVDGRIAILESAGYLTSESQDLTLVGNILAISDDPNTDVDLSGYLDNTDTQLNESQVDAFVANNGYLIGTDTLSLAQRIHLLESVNDVDSTLGEDLQNIGWVDNTNFMLITGGGSGTTITGFADSTLVADLTTSDIPEGSNLYFTNDRVVANPTVIANANKITNATHTGDVTGSTALTLSNNTVTSAKIVNGTIELTDLAYTPLTSYTETDPVYLASPAGGITNTGSGLVITSSERTAITTNTNNNAGTVAIHSDMNDPGSGAVITLIERIKLNSIESGAEVNPTDSEIKTAYENNANTNAFTDADVSTLAAAITSEVDGSITNEIQDFGEVLTESNNADGIELFNIGSPTFGSSATNKNYVDGAISTDSALDLDKSSTNEIQNLTNDATGDITLSSDATISLSGTSEYTHRGESYDFTSDVTTTSGTVFGAAYRWIRIGDYVEIKGYIQIQNPSAAIYTVEFTPPTTAGTTAFEDVDDVLGDVSVIHPTNETSDYVEVQANIVNEKIRFLPKGAISAQVDRIKFSLTYKL
jgi:hypothetical protein